MPETTTTPAAPSAAAAPAVRRKTSWAAYTQRYGAGTALVALLIFNALFTANFLTPANLLYVQLRQAAPVGIVALGMAMVIATRGIDLSVGSVMAISGQVGALALLSGTGLVPAVALALLAALLCGLFNGTLVARYGVQPIIATLILFIAGRGIAQLLTDGRLQNVDDPAFQFFGLGAIAGIPVQVVLLVVVAAAIWFVARSTPFGRYLVATGDNEPAARLAGVPVRRVKLIAYATSATLAGLVGLMEVARVSASDANNTGLGMELDAIAAVAVAGTPLTGGRISPVAVVIGALMLRLLQNTLIAHGVSREVAQMITGFIIVAAIYVQRQAGEGAG
ncbi:ABC transporter permease [Thermoactinospora rubra]|uniref:ABC transporter permease n=1 Tax=Thermoactinospora rubra TaxID=1088767 RepID=UPI000A111B8D|nr:ABC transporter permease [Thermoactinospora rubra]